MIKTNYLPRVWDEIIWYFDQTLMRNVTRGELTRFANVCKSDSNGFYTYHQVEMFINSNIMD